MRYNKRYSLLSTHSLFYYSVLKFEIKIFTICSSCIIAQGILFNSHYGRMVTGCHAETPGTISGPGEIFVRATFIYPVTLGVI